MSFSSVKKQPKSFRDQYKTATKKPNTNIPGTIEKTLRRGTHRGSSMIKIKADKDVVTDVHPYTTTANVTKTAVKPSFRTGRGSSSLVRPKRITYGLHTDVDLAPMDHTVAKQKLETLFVNKGVK
jgi:hypothetical protein